jgi:bifunctional non-homologous end joining protein LigD
MTQQDAADGPSRPEKVLWPAVGLTKRDLWDYVDACATRLLTTVGDRPLSLKRFPDGIDAEGFFQKDLPDWAPDHVRRCRVWSPTSEREIAYAVADDVADLRWLANIAVVEFHALSWRTDKPQRPDGVVLDLDPGDDGVSAVTAAWWVRETLDALGLPALVKTSGKRGLHVHVPVERRYSPGVLRGFALAIGRATVAAHPRELTVEMRKARRHGRLLVDWSRNGEQQTAVSAWSPRATPQATVATPLAWDEVDADLDPAALTISSVPQRGDPWAHPPAGARIERACHALADQGFEPKDRSPRSSAPVER